MDLIDLKLGKKLVERNRLMNRPISQYLGISVEGFSTPDNKLFCKVVLNDDDHAKNQWPFFIVGNTTDLRKLAQNFINIADEMDASQTNGASDDESVMKKEVVKPVSLKKFQKSKEAKSNQEGAPA